MRILAFAHAYVGHGREAGAETTLAGILEALKDRGWDVEVLLSKSKHPIPSYTVNGIPVKQSRDSRDLDRALVDTDILISHLECSERAAVLGKRTRVPVVQLIHNTMWQTEGYLSCGTDLAIYNTDWVAEHHSKTDRGPIVSLPQVATKKMSQRIVFAVRGQYDWPYMVVHPLIDPNRYAVNTGTHDHIGFVNFHSNKNPKLFFDMAERFPEEKFLGLLGGYGEQEVRDLPNVEIIPNTPEISRDFYSRLKMLLVPSRYESFGRVAVEAAALGVPTVASPTPGLREALMTYARYADPDDPDEWEHQIKQTMIDRKVSNGLAQYSLAQYWFKKSTTEVEALHTVLSELGKRKG